MKYRSILFCGISLIFGVHFALATQMRPRIEQDTVRIHHTIDHEVPTPSDQILDRDWIENARLGTLEIPGCAAALVSADGLAVTSASCLRSLEMWIRPSDSVFVASVPSHELQLFGLSARQLVEIQKLDSTDQDSSTAIVGMHSEIIQLNGHSWKYIWRTYDDVRLVLIPSVEVVNFGDEVGVYPRHSLDFALFRVYDQDEQPLDTESYFAWSDRIPRDREKLFSTAFLDSRPFTDLTRSETYPFNGTIAPLYTTLYGMLDQYYSHGGTGAWDLPDGWIDRIKEADLSSGLNFSLTGKCAQPGAAVVDIDMEILGIAFDHAYPEGNVRCVVVSTSGISSLLNSVLDAEAIAEELAEQARDGKDDL